MRSEILQQLKTFCVAYFDYVGPTEAPLIFHRWSLFASVAAGLGRQCWLPFGHRVLYPNMYVMLMGSPGSRKSTAISTGQSMLERTGYDKFSADRSSKERFLIDLLGDSVDDEEELVEMVLDAPSEQFIVAEEFTDFTGKNNVEFLTMLGKLWDNPPHYKQPKIHGKSVIVPQPTVNILSGNTPQAFYLAMPPESMGQGLMSRLLFVHSEPTGRKITIPPPPDLAKRQQMDRILQQVLRVKGAIKLAPETEPVLSRLYKEFKELEDYRFKYYNTRRFVHLLKLSLVFAACRFSNILEPEDCIAANTLLHYTECRMPQALGEYGKARNADVANAVIEIIKAARAPVTVRYIWKQVVQDLNRQEELQEIVRNLQHSGKIQLVEVGGKQGYTTKFETKREWDESLLWPEFLTEEEKS